MKTLINLKGLSKNVGFNWQYHVKSFEPDFDENFSYAQNKGSSTMKS